MKRRYFRMLTLLIASIFIFSSCSKDDEVENFNMDSVIGTVYMHYLPDPGPNTHYDYNYYYLYFTEDKVKTFHKDKKTGEIQPSTTREYFIRGNVIINKYDNNSLGTVGKGCIIFLNSTYYPTSLKLGDLLGDPQTKN